MSRSDADLYLLKKLKTYIDYARSEVNEAQLTATQKDCQIEKNLLVSTEAVRIGVAVLKNNLQAARQYKQETTNYADLAKSTFDGTMSSIPRGPNNLEAMANESFSKRYQGHIQSMTNMS